MCYDITIKPLEEVTMAKLRIREIAEKQGLNQKELADKSGVSAQLINRYWNYPMQRVELDALAKIAKALNCKLADLIEVDDEDDGEKAA
jgi:DNA-binding Xre family transcriptional regulator